MSSVSFTLFTEIIQYLIFFTNIILSNAFVQYDLNTDFSKDNI